MLGVKPYSSPMVPGIHFTREGKTFEDPERYRRLIGKLNYLCNTPSQIRPGWRVQTESEMPLNCDAPSWGSDTTNL